MSIDTVLSRISQIQAMTAPVVPLPQVAPTTTSPTDTGSSTFADTLAQAQSQITSAAPAGSLAAPLSTATGTLTGDGGSTQFDADIQAAAQQNGVDPALIKAVVQQESGFDPNATSGAGAQGLMQLMPSTAAGLGVTNPLDPAQSIQAGTKYLKSQLDRFGGNVSLALAAYNAGPNAVARYGGVPPFAETQKYVQSVLADYQAFSSSSPTTGRGLS